MTLRIRLKFFALFKEVAGCDRVDKDIKSGWTVKDLVQDVLEEFPGLKKYEDDIIVSVNRSYSPEDTVLEDGDEVAIFPPVGGG
jgi:molybdopterin converting factor subunit 1